MLALVFFVVPLCQIEANIDNFLPSALICSEISLLVAQKLQSQPEPSLIVLAIGFGKKLSNLIVEVDIARDDLSCAMRSCPLIKLNVNPGLVRPSVTQRLFLAIFGTWKHKNFVSNGRRRHADRIRAAEACDFLQTLWITHVAVGKKGLQAQFIADCRQSSSRYGLFRALHEARVVAWDHP